MPQVALLLIDAQISMFRAGNSVYDSQRILSIMKQLLSLARSRKMPVVFVQNNGKIGEPDESYKKGWEIHPELKTKPEDFVTQKFEMDAFAKNSLHEQLQKIKITHLIVTGLQSEFCIRTNCLKAKELGYQVILVKDGHSTYDSKEKNAPQIIDEINAELSSVIHLKPSEQILNAIQK